MLWLESLLALSRVTERSVGKVYPVYSNNILPCSFNLFLSFLLIQRLGQRYIGNIVALNPILTISIAYHHHGIPFEDRPESQGPSPGRPPHSPGLWSSIGLHPGGDEWIWSQDSVVVSDCVG